MRERKIPTSTASVKTNVTNSVWDALQAGYLRMCISLFSSNLIHFYYYFFVFLGNKKYFNLWKRKRTSFWLFTPYIHLIFVSNVNEWRVFIKFKNWLLEFHIIASRLYSKSTKIFSLHEIRGKKNPITVRIISTSLVHSKGEPGHKNENNLQWMKTDIYQSCLSIIQHFLVFEMRALNNARMKLVCEVISCWN